MSTTSAEADGICLENGKPISELKVVELRKELENRSLPKSGNKKELYDRLKNYLITSGEGIVGSPGRDGNNSSANASPVKSPEPTENPMIAKYRASQEQALREARRDAELIRGTSGDDEAPETPAPEAPTRKSARLRTDSSSSKKSVHEEKEEINPLPVVEEEPENNNKKDAEAVKEVEKAVEEDKGAESDSGGESTKSFIEDKEAEVEEKKQGEEPQKAVLPVESKPVAKETPPADSSSSSDDEEADKAEASSSSASPARESSPPAVAKEAHPEVKAPEVKEAKEPVVELPSSLVDTQVELDYEEEDEDNEDSNKVSPAKDQLSRDTPHVMTDSIVRATNESASDTTIKAPDSAGKEESVTTAEGLVRRRAASPARTSVTQLIHIRGLKRPFTVKGLHTLLGQFGTLNVEEFWIDSIKSNCIAKFETEEQAEAARNGLHNVIWPASSDLSLSVEYTTDDKLARRREDIKETGFGLTVMVDNSSAKRMDVDAPGRRASQDASMNDLIVTAREGGRGGDGARSPSRKRKAVDSGEPQKTLEDLFKKTVTQPCVYYLPLTEEQAQKRAEKKKLEKEKEPARPNRTGSDRRRPSPVGAASGRRSPDRKRERRDSPPRGFRRH